MEINKIRAAAEIAKSKTSDQRWLNSIKAAVATALIVGPIHSLGQLWANNGRDDVESERWQADAPKKRGDSYTPEPATLYFVLRYVSQVSNPDLKVRCMSITSAK